LHRVVCDVGVVISALISPRGVPAKVLALWRDGRYDLVVSPLWLDELERVLDRPRFASYVRTDDRVELRNALARQAILALDPPAEPGLTPDPGDDYLVALARATDASWLVSGDRHLLELDDPRPPVLTPRVFLDTLPPSRS
jgi:putative PIN family toxin of toxin-antitoxin system